MAKIEQLPKEQRLLVGEELRKLIKKLKIKSTDGEAISALRKKLPKDLVPDNFEIKSLRQWVRGGAKGLLQIPKKVEGIDTRGLREYDVPGRTYKGKDAKIINQIRDNTKKFIDIVTGDPNLGGLAYEPALVEKYFHDTNNQLKRLMTAVRNQNKKLPKGKRISFGHLNRLSESINSPRNVFLELLTENIDKGNRYMENPYAMLAIGNPTKEGLSSIDNWVRDFLFYADDPKHGGTGVLPQRGDFGSVVERQIHNLTGNQWNKLDEAGKIKAMNQVEDFLGEIEGRNQWTIGQKAKQRKWGILSQSQAQQALALENDAEFKLAQKAVSEGTETGARLGGVGNKIKHKGGLMNTLGRVARSPGGKAAIFFGVGGAGALFSDLGAHARELEAAESPDDPWLQFQAKLDRTTATLDKAVIAGNVWAAPATAAAEIGSMGTSALSMGMDFTRWVKDPIARKQTTEWWTDVYKRGRRIWKTR